MLTRSTRRHCWRLEGYVFIARHCLQLAEASAQVWHSAAHALLLMQEHAKHLADSSRADRSVQEQDADLSGATSGTAQQQQLHREGGSGKARGGSKQLGRKHGAALLVKRGSSADGTGAGALAEAGGSSLSIAQGAGLRADADATDMSNGDADQSGSQRGSTAQLDQHARQQVSIGCFPSTTCAASSLSTPAVADA